MAWKCGLDSPGDQRLRGKAIVDQAASGKGPIGMTGGLQREEEPAGGRGCETAEQGEGKGGQNGGSGPDSSFLHRGPSREGAAALQPGAL